MKSCSLKKICTQGNHKGLPYNILIPTDENIHRANPCGCPESLKKYLSVILKIYGSSLSFVKTEFARNQFFSKN